MALLYTSHAQVLGLACMPQEVYCSLPALSPETPGCVAGSPVSEAGPGPGRNLDDHSEALSLPQDPLGP